MVDSVWKLSRTYELNIVLFLDLNLIDHLFIKFAKLYVKVYVTHCRDDINSSHCAADQIAHF
jgi:hypothetical protein